MSEKTGLRQDEGNPAEEQPERTDETAEPSKGSGSKEDVQKKPEDQRGRPDPKYKDSMSGG